MSEVPLYPQSGVAGAPQAGEGGGDLIVPWMNEHAPFVSHPRLVNPRNCSLLTTNWPGSAVSPGSSRVDRSQCSQIKSTVFPLKLSLLRPRPNRDHDGLKSGLRVIHSVRSTESTAPASTACTPSLSVLDCRRWSSNPYGKCSYERPTRGTVCGTMRSMCGADAGCLAINYQSLS